MSNHLKTGKYGESLAVIYFIEKGYKILHTNWRYKNLEIDILAEKAGVLHIIEVKTISTEKFGFPEAKVGAKKLKFMIDAAEEFLYSYPYWERIQFDILAIVLKPSIHYFIIEDVYIQ